MAAFFLQKETILSSRIKNQLYKYCATSYLQQDLYTNVFRIQFNTCILHMVDNTTNTRFAKFTFSG